MKLFKMYKRDNILRILKYAFFVILISCSLTIDSIVQPASITGGQMLNVTLNCNLHTNQSQTSKFMVAVLVPKLWKARQNATITFISTVSTGPQSMSPVPTGQPAPQANGLDWPSYIDLKIGHGSNLLSDWEWVAFYSNVAYTVAANLDYPITVSIKIQTTTDNLEFKLGYVIANDADGLSNADRYGSFFPNCLKVNGTGDLIDFCNPQLSNIEPRTSLDNDIITLSFDASISANQLSNATNVYLCATGILTDGTKINKCVQTTANHMTSIGNNKFRIDIWPRAFFGLEDTQRLASLEYFFTDLTGNLIVGYGGGDLPFTYTFKCP